MKYIVILAISILLCVSVHGQTRPVTKRNYRSVLIDTSKPSVFAEFLDFDVEDKVVEDASYDLVRLKITNNSTWSISLGIFTLVSGRTSVYYTVEKACSKDDIFVPIGPVRSDVGSPDTELKPGKSIIVSVLKEHLTDCLKFRIDFEYSWEYGLGGTLPRVPRHSLYFYPSDIPEKFTNPRKLTKTTKSL